MNSKLNPLVPHLAAEWLEADGQGGFASGTVSGIRTRRYHALLLTAQTPPTDRRVLVNGFEAWLETPVGSFALSSQRYCPDVTHPDGATRIVEFTTDPWPRWIFQLPDRTRLAQEIFVPHGHSATVVAWKLLTPAARVELRVRPLLSGRDYHSLHHENPTFRFDATVVGESVEWCPYPGIPRIDSRSNGTYRPDPRWYRQFQYDEERARGLDFTEDLASPGEFRWPLSDGEAVWLLQTEEPAGAAILEQEPVAARVDQWRTAEISRRKQFGTPLHRAADAYIVKRAGAPNSNSNSVEAKTIIAGYPWFTDWGRDTFIALRGLCLATNRWADAQQILLAWAKAISAGMVPNRFPDHGEQPEFNAVDASLWYIVAIHDFLAGGTSPSDSTAARGTPRSDSWTTDPAVVSRLQRAVEDVLEGYSHGTRHHICAMEDGLLAAGEPGVQLTWMDAKVGDWVVTPRIGKPVEVQALWINALRIASQWNPQWRTAHELALASFLRRFWNQARQCLFDVVDVDHVADRNDDALRPNQILAVGGLPFPILEGERARQVVNAVEAHLYTPLGLRSLAPSEPNYSPHYEGGVRQRDGAYHQGTVWPWLIGAFVEAWLRVHGDSPATRSEARDRFLSPFREHRQQAGLGHISEIVDAEAPYTPRGCPWQAWSVGEVLRLERMLGDEVAPRVVRARKTSPKRSGRG